MPGQGCRSYAAPLLMAGLLLWASVACAAEPSQRIDLQQPKTAMSALQDEAVRRAAAEFTRLYPWTRLEAYRVGVDESEQMVYVVFEDHRLPPPDINSPLGDRGSGLGMQPSFAVSLSKPDLRILNAHFVR